MSLSGFITFLVAQTSPIAAIVILTAITATAFHLLSNLFDRHNGR